MRTLLFVLLVLAVGCAVRPFDESAVQSADETATEGTEGLSSGATLPVGSTLETTANLNLRKGASTSDAILHVIPQGATVTTVNRTTPVNGFFNVKHGGTEGWAYGAYLQRTSDGGGGSSGGNRDDAIEKRAKPAVGFSYWWGHGRWLPNGPSSPTRGSCSGSCPSCSHSGSNGADCSGFVAKVWQVPSSNTSLSDDAHPYSTYDFDNHTYAWSTVSRGSLKKADALVMNANGSGHIFLYESGDGWGSMWAYEAKGCSYGIVHNLRTATSAYKGIRRNGY